MIGDYVLATIFAGIDEVARENGVMAITASTLDEPALRAERTFKMLDHLVDGMIFADAHLDEHFLDGIEAQRVPFTLVHRRHSRHISVTADDRAAGRMAAEHLISLGRTRLAMVTGRRYMSTGTDRVEGFVSAALEAGLPEPTIYDNGFTVRAGRDAAVAMLARPPYPDGLFAFHDLAILGAASVFRHHGLRVPDDIATVGFYDSPMAWASDMTSIGVNLQDMGRRSLELLLDRLSGKPIESEVFPVTLTVRHSTDPSRPVGSPMEAPIARAL
jgi:LacI family transcriptional regulator